MPPDGHDTHIDFAMLNDFADGDLAGRAAAAVRAHLRACAACREDVRFIRSSGETIRYLPTPKPPDELFDDLFREDPGRVTVLPLGGPREESGGTSRSLWFSSIAVGVVALLVAGLLLTVGSDRAMAGSSTLTFERTGDGPLALRFETMSALAEEASLRARVRYWVPDSLRYVQGEPGFAAVDLSREDLGRFEGFLDLPAGAAYAVATVEDREGNYIDTDFGRFWEYLETDAQGRPTLQARRYQVLATSEFSASRTATVAEQAASEFPDQPELWFWYLLYRFGGLPGDPVDTLSSQYLPRLHALDRAAREGDPGPVEMDALMRYARFFDLTEMADYWASELLARHPRSGQAAQVALRSIFTSAGTTEEKLDALAENWAITGAPVTAQVGLNLSRELADPALTSTWLGRRAANSALRDLSSDVDVAERMMEVSALWPVAEGWMLGRLADSRDWVGPARPLDQSRLGFEAEVRQTRARLHLLLSRIRVARGDSAGAVEVLERSVAETWTPQVFVQAAEIHHAMGLDLRAAQLAALARVDPVTPLAPHLDGEDEAAWFEPTRAQLAAAEATMHERIASELLDERVNLNARLRDPSGGGTTLREAAGPHGAVTLILHTVSPGDIPDDEAAFLQEQADRLKSAGVHTLFVTQRPPSPGERPGTDRSFHQDVNHETWEALGVWRAVRYFVLDGSGSLRHRGEDPRAALRIALLLTANVE